MIPKHHQWLHPFDCGRGKCVGPSGLSAVKVAYGSLRALPTKKN
jgi:hypothetical protein